MKLEFPKGRERHIDLLSSAGDVYTFGGTGRKLALQAPRARVFRISFWLCIISMLGMTFGFLMSGAYLLILTMGLVILFFAILTLVECIHTVPSGETIVIDAQRQIVNFENTRPVSGTIPMQELTLAVHSEEGGDHLSSRKWWVMIEGKAGEDREGVWTFQVTLFGPGNRPDMLAAANQIARLGPWFEVESLGSLA